MVPVEGCALPIRIPASTGWTDQPEMYTATFPGEEFDETLLRALVCRRHHKPDCITMSGDPCETRTRRSAAAATVKRITSPVCGAL
jgi:hypothetical protein